MVAGQGPGVKGARPDGVAFPPRLLDHLRTVWGPIPASGRHTDGLYGLTVKRQQLQPASS